MEDKTFTSHSLALNWARGLITQLVADEINLIAGDTELTIFRLGIRHSIPAMHLYSNIRLVFLFYRLGDFLGNIAGKLSTSV